MSIRINNLLTHISAKCGDSVEMQHVKQRLAQASLANQFILSDTHMKEMLMFMLHEMVEGLEGRTSTIRMLPSFVYKSNPSTSSGVFYAVDLGGTNFRVLRLVLTKGTLVHCTQEKYIIPKAARRGDQDDLFGFMARSLKKMMLEKAPEDVDKTMPLGFTFSFPCDQKSVNSGNLLLFGKHFATKNVVGRDVVELLQLALHREALQAVVVALCNDTVGTLVAKYFEDENCQVGVIIGTGCNVSYFERSDAVTKQPDVAAHGALMTPINMECGNFDSTHKYVLPITPFDEAMDAITPNEHQQRTEKIVSGLYLGEIARQVLLKLAQIGCLPADLATGLSKPWGFETRYMGMVCADQIPGLQFTRNLVKQVTGVDLQDAEDLHLFREVCRMVRNRSAQLSSVVTSAPILKNHTQGLASVAVDGSVYEKTPSFQRLYQESITRLLGKESNVRVSLQKDGSG
eukprot:gene12438-biopygen9142